MAGNPATIKEELEMSLAEDSVPENQPQSQENMAITEMIERGPWSPGVSQRRQKLESKAAPSGAHWTTSTSRVKKTGHHSQLPRMQRDQGHGEAHENPGHAPSMRYSYDRREGLEANTVTLQEAPCIISLLLALHWASSKLTVFPAGSPATSLVAEIGLEELTGLEMEVMRRQMQVITARLRVLEDHDATWRYKETLLFTLLVSACIVNLWLWIRQ
ncbi:fetal and adult testis-expressed transcript protein [Perognathus longimembris pacificus]|uniref:fetal and adult testis-expressed transcript protein n=1 Tax=Perognathus longimembris pacificus TaxID=214514 RepID=UPI002018AFB2|nr:fetal and adult testis-expressed transcript protein [Perognathus longimembris pacificus]